MNTVVASIYNVGTSGDKQAACRPPDAQWFYRVRDPITGRQGKWLECPKCPDGAWYDPNAGDARLPAKVAP